MKKVRIVFALVAALSVISTTANADMAISPTTAKVGLWLVDNGGLNAMQPGIWANSKVDFSNTQGLKLCGEITSQICTDGALLQINNFLQLCTSDTDTNCISSVWGIDQNGKKVVGTPGKRIPAASNGDYSAQPKMNLPAGKGQGNIFNFPGLNHLGGNDNYFVSVRDFYSLIKEPGVLATDLKYEVNNLNAAIIPVNEYQGAYKAPQVRDGYSGGGVIGVSPTGATCNVTDEGTCLVFQDFAPGLQFGLSIRLAAKIISWFHGRIHSPLIQTKARGSGEEVIIQAEPVRVTSLDFLADSNSLPQNVKDFVFSGRQFGILGDGSGMKLNAGLDSSEARELLSLFSPVFKDKSTRESTVWNVQSMVPQDHETQVSKCARDASDIAGIVTTNSLLYSSGPPTFNSSTQTLDYQLASPHFESNGTVTSGSYDLSIRSDVARCIYGFSKAPVTASISVISSDGSPKVATTVLGEKVGWLYLTAQGFDFSSPTVKVKLSQSPTSGQTPSNSMPQKQVSITCVKGKVSKKVTGKSPTCPVGFKKI